MVMLKVYFIFSVTMKKMSEHLGGKWVLSYNEVKEGRDS